MVCRGWVATALMLGLLFTGSVARAQNRDDEARGLFAAGEAAYRDGRFEDALRYFRQSFELSSRPQLLYNIGLAEANLGHDREALEAFQRYLQELPAADNRGVVEGRVTALQQRIREEDERQRRLTDAEAQARAQREQQAQQPSQGAAPAAASSEGPSVLAWALTIGGGALVVGGAVLLAIGLSDVSTVEGAADGTPWVDLESANDRAPVMTGVGIGLGIAGLAAASLGVVLLVSSGGSSSSTERSLSLGPGGLTLRGSF